MYHNELHHSFELDGKEYAVKDMVDAIYKRYPDIHSYGFKSVQNHMIDVTMSMDIGEQTSYMIQSMAKMIREDRRCKAENDSLGRKICARNFLVAVSLHAIYRKYIREDS